MMSGDRKASRKSPMRAMWRSTAPRGDTQRQRQPCRHAGAAAARVCACVSRARHAAQREAAGARICVCMVHRCRGAVPRTRMRQLRYQAPLLARTGTQRQRAQQGRRRRRALTALVAQRLLAVDERPHRQEGVHVKVVCRHAAPPRHRRDVACAPLRAPAQRVEHQPRRRVAGAQTGGVAGALVVAQRRQVRVRCIHDHELLGRWRLLLRLVRLLRLLRLRLQRPLRCLPWHVREGLRLRAVVQAVQRLQGQGYEG